MRTLLLLVVFIFLLPVFGFYSCERCEKAEPYFNINGISCGNFIASLTRFSDGSGWRLVKDGEAVSFKDHFIRAGFSLVYYSHQKQKKGLGGLGVAYALSCQEPGYAGSTEGLDTLYLITQNAWDDRHPANDTLNDILEVGGFITDYRSLDTFYPLADYSIENQSRIRDQIFSLRLTQEPAFKDSDHRFKLVYHLKNGEVHTAETTAIRFTQ